MASHHARILFLPAVHRADHSPQRSLARHAAGDRQGGYAPLDVGVDELVHVAGARWAIEECFQAAKNECGLDEYEVRRYVGWYRHITLAMLAHTFLVAMSARAAEKGDPPVRMPWPSSSPWQKCGDSWQLTHPETFTPSLTC
jgi:hypothetical protein